MFSKSVFGLVLALAALTHVSADAVSDEESLVGKLRLAATAVDRINLLPDDKDFAFDFFDPKAAATVGAGGKIVTANAATFPAVIGTNSAMAVGFLDACSMNTPHMHPRATEIQISLNGTIRTGMITENGGRFIMTELPAGSMTIFPMGSVHFQVNDGCEPLEFVAAFNNEDPGVLQMAQRLFGLTPDIVAATFGDLGVEEVHGLESIIPDNIAIATDDCLKRCGLTRPVQSTKQLQPQVSGNSFPSSASTTYSYGYNYGSKGASTKTSSTYSTKSTGTYSTSTKTSSTYSSSSTGYHAAPVNHVIKVGANGLNYSPSNISAAVGDTITFEFHQKNHTVTESSFLHPCEALGVTNPGTVGFKSGFKFVADSVTSNFPTFNITVNDTAPIWGYCGQTGHCQSGMVFSINAVESGPNNFAAFKKLAMAGASSTSYFPNPTPPAQSYSTATATMTHGGKTWTTVYTSYAGTPSPTYAPSPVNHVIKVGADGLNYSPSNISASIGDTVTFEFHQVNHTVTESSFLHPCEALGTTNPGAVGFKSGFKPVAAGVTSNFPTFKITVNDTAPIWGYCGQTGHCQSGMVFSINAVESGPNNFAAFKKLAMAGAVSYANENTKSTGYGATYANDNTKYPQSTYSYNSASASAALSMASQYTSGIGMGEFGGSGVIPGMDLAAAAASTDDGSSGGSSKKISTPVIALIAINGTLVIGLIVLGALYLRKRRSNARVSRHKQLYTSVSATGDPIFVAPTKLTQYEDKEEHAGADTPLTHGLTHGPYYDPHEPGSRPHSRSPSRLR
ncbi:hypothetical protein C8R47DRAFT_1080683 [Mycena vitilis]|nr:hypothetical protein C8R47DRAFT_1080683 [Mycena vitilis]